MNFKETDYLNKNNIRYILISKIDEQIIITNTENYFKSMEYKSLCKYSHLSKLKIENKIYIPELFIDSYASWYSSIYYLNKFKVNKIESPEKSNQSEELETLKDILKCVISIKTDLATIQTIQTKSVTKNIKSIVNDIKSSDTFKNVASGIENKMTDIFSDIPLKKVND